MRFPTSVKIVEVSARDGLQNEAKIVPTEIKIQFINQLSTTGLSAIEVTSFVSPKWIPQLADHQQVYADINKLSHISYPVFVPNIQGLKTAIALGVKEVAVFATPSETFCLRNINCTLEENLVRLKLFCEIAALSNIKVRGYVSCVMGCPYEGDMNPNKVALLSRQLLALGCYEISLGDTIGIGTPGTTSKLLSAVLNDNPVESIAVHFHDTYGQALVNIYVALQHGIRVIDSSVAGLGGCPYAKGASGNVATEDLLYMLNGLNIKTGVDLTKVVAAGKFMTDFLQKTPQSKLGLL